jgi:hypothetical protein
MDPDGHIRFRCKSCGKKLRVKLGASGGGQLTHCPKCGNLLLLPINQQNGDVQEEAHAHEQDEVVLKSFGTEEAYEKTVEGLQEFARRHVPEPQEQAAQAPEEKEARPRWAPKLGMKKVTESFEELRDFRNRLDQIESDIYERVVSVFKDEGASAERREAMLRRIGQDRRTHYQLAYEKTRDMLLDELKYLMNEQEAGRPHDMRRVLQLKGAIQKLDSYGLHVLQIKTKGQPFVQ